MLVAALLSLGTFFYSYAEGWTHIDAFYFSTMTLTTIGYGDLVPSSEGGKIFTSFYAIFGIGIMLYILSSVIGVFVFRQEGKVSRAFSFIKRLRKQEKELSEHEKEIRAIQERVRKPFLRRIREQEIEIRILKQKLAPTIRKQKKVIRTLRKVRPSIRKIKQQQKEIRKIKKSIRRKRS
jgi:septal ring factor EnvC (AmiA/AmiB activator)